MNSILSVKIASFFLVLSFCMLGYVITSTRANAPSSYGLTCDNIPCQFADDKTLVLDIQTNNRAVEIHEDYLYIRSQYLSFYDLNVSDGHQDTNLVSGNYVYCSIPAQNATVTAIRPIDRFQLSSTNGSVTVSTSSYSTDKMTLQVNSSYDASLTIRAVGLEWPYRYAVSIDGVEVSRLQVSVTGYVQYTYSGPWSNHTITLTNIGAPVPIPQVYLSIIQIFLILGLVVSVTKTMILPIRQKNVPAPVITKNLIYAAIYIVVGIAMILLVFDMFVGE